MTYSLSPDDFKLMRAAAEFKPIVVTANVGSKNEDLHTAVCRAIQYLKDHNYNTSSRITHLLHDVKFHCGTCTDSAMHIMQLELEYVTQDTTITLADVDYFIDVDTNFITLCMKHNRTSNVYTFFSLHRTSNE